MVITRQRPGTAKGFVFLTLEDETGISNVIIRPDLFDRERLVVIRHPFLIVDGVLQHQDGVLSIRAERVEGIDGGASIDAHDFYYESLERTGLTSYCAGARRFSSSNQLRTTTMLVAVEVEFSSTLWLSLIIRNR